MRADASGSPFYHRLPRTYFQGARAHTYRTLGRLECVRMRSHRRKRNYVIGKGGSKMGETSKHASSKHKRKEHRLTEKALARDGSARLAEAARKREGGASARR